MKSNVSGKSQFDREELLQKKVKKLKKKIKSLEKQKVPPNQLFNILDSEMIKKLRTISEISSGASGKLLSCVVILNVSPWLASIRVVSFVRVSIVRLLFSWAVLENTEHKFTRNFDRVECWNDFSVLEVILKPIAARI